MSASTIPAPPRPRHAAPALDLPLTRGGRFVLSEQRPERFTLVAVYRGRHCPKCRQQLRELEARLDEITARGIEVVAVSGNDAEDARATLSEWGIERLAVAHGLDEETMRAWGLYVSAATKDDEPERFSEPGLFLVSPDGTLYAAMIQSMPFARPRLDDVLAAVDFIVEQDYPARGEA